MSTLQKRRKNAPLNTENLTPIGALVAYDIALGLDYGDIAFKHKLTLDQVEKIGRGNLVKKQVREFQQELKERLVEEASQDPVRQFLSEKGMTFAKTIVKEAQNMEQEEGANASTRLKAAELGLKMSGRDFAGEKKQPIVQINISSDKVNKAKDIQSMVRDKVPDYVDG